MSATTIHQRFCLILGVLIETRWTHVLQCFVSEDLDDKALDEGAFSKETLRKFHVRHGLPPDFLADFWAAKSSFFLPKIQQGGHHVIRKDDLLPISFENPDKPLGKGAHGTVYGASLIPGLHWSSKTHTRIAVKKFDEAKVRTHEYKMIRKFDAHPYILPALCSIDHGSSYYILFPRGKMSLRQRFQYEDCNSSPAEFLKHYVGLLDALGHLHKEEPAAWNCHFDIKTSNILIKYDGKFVLIDFGTSYSKIKFHAQDSGTEAQRHSHSAEYKAPESGKIGRKFDVWAIACIGLELLVWIDEGWKGVRSFAKSRRGDMPRDGGISDRTPYFYVDGKHAPSVQSMLGKLGQKYPEEIKILRRMLKIDPNDRFTAEMACLRFRECVNVSFLIMVWYSKPYLDRH